MAFVRSIKGLSSKDVSLAGGKGASLGEMTNAGIPVPPGFVILSDSFERFLNQTGLHSAIDSILHGVRPDEIHTVEDASERIKALIIDANIPKEIQNEVNTAFKKLDARFVAVRSSATAEDSAIAAWAGQLESYLNTTENHLLENVKHCWASLFTPRAIFYRHEKNLHETHISVAVVVQKMVDSDASGVAFSVHPVTQDHNQLIIEAGLGLGEAIVSGQITPDCYVVEKDALKIIDAQVHQQDKSLHRSEKGGNTWVKVPAKQQSVQKLKNSHVIELSKLIITIERHYGFPVDVEWAIQDGNFYILQSRPITTLSSKATPPKKALPSNHPLVHYTGKTFTKLGAWKGLLPLDNETWNSSESSALFEEIFGISKGIPWVFTSQDETTHIYLPTDLKKSIHQRIQVILQKDPKALQTILESFYVLKDQAITQLNTSLSISLGGISDDAVCKLYADNRKIIHKAAAFDHLGFLAEEYWPARLEECLVKRLGMKKGSKEYNETLMAFITPSRPSTTLNEKKAILEQAILIKNKKQTVDAASKMLGESFGWLPVFAYGTPWGEAHYRDELIKTIEVSLPILQKEKMGVENYSKNRTDRIETILKKHKLEWDDIQEFVDFSLVIDTRNEAEYLVSLGGFCLIRLYHEIARRLSITVDQLRLFEEEEIILALRKKISTKDILAKKSECIAFGFDQSLKKRKSIHGKEAGDFYDFLEANLVQQTSTSNEAGLCASIGKATGIARIVSSPADNSKVNKGDILISHLTTVDYLPAMKNAAAIVTEVGGLTSHAAVVAREFGIPCIVSFPDAMKKIKDGDLIEVDADKGVVKNLGSTEKSKKRLPFYEKSFSRDFSLAIIECWANGESNDKRQYTQKEQPFKPYILFERTPLTVNCYIDPQGIAWIKQRLIENIKKDPSFVKKAAQTFISKGKAIQEIWEGEKTLSIAELKGFLSSLRDTWPWFEAVWWLIELSPEEAAGVDVEPARRARIAMDRMCPGADAVILKSISAKYPSIAKYANVLTAQEVFSGKIPELKTLKNRANGYFYGNGTLFTGKTIAEIEDNFKIEIERVAIDASSKEIRGDVAFKGKVQGIVRLVMGRSAVPSLKPGEILVTSMTLPDFAPAMKKAAAFITDEGGITCHAAIMAREFKKPCVIGTKIATKLLKDGDVVEVDANKGIVRKLS